MNKDKPIAKLRAQKTSLFLILLTAILLALSINLLISYAVNELASDPIYLLISGLVILFLALIFLCKIFLSSTTMVIRLYGAMAFEIDNDKLSEHRIIGYKFSDDFCKYLIAFIQENKAYGRLFFSSKHDKRDSVDKPDKFDPDEINHNSIINSILEFMVLTQLHLHLNSYFVKNEIDKQKITSISRNDLDPSVLKNRVIDLITKDMKEREAFKSEDDSDYPGVICMAQGENGAIYERLDIELPPKSSIHRSSNGYLVISNNIFDIMIMPKFEGFVTYVSPQLMSSTPNTYCPFMAYIKIIIKIKRRAFFTNESMEMYEWLDSFIEDLENYVSIKKLEKRLDPDLIEALRS